MLPIQEKLTRPAEAAFRFGRRLGKAFAFEWHQHPEYELTLIETGRGQRFVGDHIQEYQPGDLVLLGPDLPHTLASYDDTADYHRASVVQFSGRWIDPLLDVTPEARAIHSLLRRSRRGLCFTGPAAQHALDQMPTMNKRRGMAKVITLLDLLDRMARNPQVQPLASPAYTHTTHLADKRIDRVCRFIHDHATEPITQAQAADLAHMSCPAFSRFFKQRVGMTYSRYLHELRIGHACRLLIESDAPITEACFASGFNNLSNFNRVFRVIKGTSPRHFRQNHTRHDT